MEIRVKGYTIAITEKVIVWRNYKLMVWAYAHALIVKIYKLSKVKTLQ